MENPHAERQAVLLERILKNASACTEMIMELNHCVEEILQANASIKIAADLATKYRKNVQYSLAAAADSELQRQQLQQEGQGQGRREEEVSPR